MTRDPPLRAPPRPDAEAGEPRRTPPHVAARRFRVMPPTATLVAAVGGLWLAGCAALPDMDTAPLPRDADQVEAARALDGGSAEWPVEGWWRAFGDPQLDRLVEAALKDSPTLAAAEARLRRADALAGLAAAARRPSLSLAAEIGGQELSENNAMPVPEGFNDVGRVGLSGSWSLDPFGRDRAVWRAALTEAQATGVERDAARLTLATAVASAYADYIHDADEVGLAGEALRIRTETEALVLGRTARGLDNRATLRQAESATASARERLEAAEEALALTRNRLAELVGRGPDFGLDLEAPAHVPVDLAQAPAVLPLDLIGRRPDLVAARFRAAAAARRIDASVAGFYPSLNLNVFAGVQSLGLDNLTASGSETSSAVLALNLPIFRGGALRADLRARRAEYDEAVATYDGRLLSAVRDVADALVVRRRLAARLAAAKAAETAADDAWRLARARYEGGLSTYLDALTAETSLLETRRRRAALESRAMSVEVQLIRALGGGYSAEGLQLARGPEHVR